MRNKPEHPATSLPVCLSCWRPLCEEEIDLNGLKCNDCDHYDRTMAAEPADDDLDEMERRSGSI